MSTISLCKRCVERISDCYRMTPIDQSTTFCILCHGNDAKLYDFQPKHMPVQRKKKPVASAGPRADREKAMRRRRWA